LAFVAAMAGVWPEESYAEVLLFASVADAR